MRGASLDKLRTMVHMDKLMVNGVYSWNEDAVYTNTFPHVWVNGMILIIDYTALYSLMVQIYFVITGNLSNHVSVWQQLHTDSTFPSWLLSFLLISFLLTTSFYVFCRSLYFSFDPCIVALQFAFTSLAVFVWSNSSTGNELNDKIFVYGHIMMICSFTLRIVMYYASKLYIFKVKF